MVYILERSKKWLIRTLQLREQQSSIGTLQEERSGPDKYGDEILQVAVEYKNFPPRIVQISGNGQTVLTENQLSLLDDAEITNIDLIIRPYNYNVNGKSGVKAYCKTMYVTLQEEFGGKYADIPYSNEERSAMDEQMDNIPF